MLHGLKVPYMGVGEVKFLKNNWLKDVEGWPGF
jgi:hypothetical protein